MPAPDPSLIVSDPAPPLNPSLPWPYKISEYPASRLLDPLFGNPPKEAPKPPPPNPNRLEAR